MTTPLRRRQRLTASLRLLRQLVLTLQVLALLAYVLLHSPAMSLLARALHLRSPDFCYFVCP